LPKFSRDAHNKDIIDLVFVPTAEQLADGMTKALPYSTFLAISIKYNLYYYEFFFFLVVTTICQLAK
jgi:hypothetical protein